MTTHPYINHEPYRLLAAAANGTVTLPNSFNVAAAARSSLAGFGGLPVVIVIRNVSGDGTATGAAEKVQIETTYDSPGSVTNVSSPAGFLKDVFSIDDGDSIAYEVTGPPGQYWRILNSTTKPIRVEYYYKPQRN